MGRVILTVALAATLALAVVACGDGGGADTGSTTPTPTPTETQAAPTEASTPAGPSTTEVADLFTDNCAGCHAPDGSGGSGPDLRGEDDLAGVRAQIESGGGEMPAFSGQLPPGQIDALAQYVVSELR